MLNMNYRFACLLIAVCVFALASKSAGESAGEGKDSGGAQAVGISERLGRSIPLDIPFRDESGKEVVLRDIIDRPVLMVPAYYRCTRVCVDMLSGVADVLGKTDAAPGKDYKVITVSFDERDTPLLAAQKKKDYLMAASIARGGGAFPPDAWTFLTGDAASIKRLALATGFAYRKDADGFDHTSAIMVISPRGTIIRYMYGTAQLPKEIEMALIEAQGGRPAASIPKLLAYCFRKDPKGGSYVAGLLKVSALVVSAMAAGLFIYLSAKGGRKGL